MNRHVIKRLFDIVFSLIAILLLSLPLLLVALVICIDDPGPPFFRQRRVGIKRGGQITYFYIWKFRSMKMSTPQDIPTHLLQDPEQYITRVGRFIRRMSIDELPQIYQILTGKLSFIGPRPALWSQDDLVAERERYGANDVKPGLSGWAQINGRDELPISVKAKLDGEYATALTRGAFRGFFMDVRCFFGTFLAVFRSDGYLEGGLQQQDTAEQADEVTASAEQDNATVPVAEQAREGASVEQSAHSDR